MDQGRLRLSCWRGIVAQRGELGELFHAADLKAAGPTRFEPELRVILFITDVLMLVALGAPD